MELYLVRHGEARNGADDAQRSLSDAGRRAVERMAAMLARQRASVRRIEHSDKLRARQTAEIIAARLEPRDGIHQVAGLAPNDDIVNLVERLRAETGSLMLVGHLPFMSLLAARLLGMPDGSTVQFDAGGVASLERDSARRWNLVWSVSPELLW